MSEGGRFGDRRALEADDLAGPRLAKADAAQFPNRFETTATAAELHAQHGDLEPEAATGQQAIVAGRLVGKREMGKLTFGVLQDGTGRIQLLADASVLGGRYGEFGSLDLGDWVGASGEIVTTRKGELSVKADDFTLLAKSLREMPEKFHGVSDDEIRHRQRYLDLIANEEARNTVQIHSAALRALRESFWARGFMEVETPALEYQASGALARPFRTHHNALDQDMHLRIALELPLKKLIVGGIDKVFEMGRVFRNEGVSPRHNPEFTMLEAYQAHADYRDMMELVESVVAEAAQAAAGSTRLTYQGKPIDFSTPWRRAPFMDLIAQHAGDGFDLDTELSELGANAEAIGIAVDPTWDEGKILAAVFERKAEEHLWDPTFVVDYPKSISPFSKVHRDDQRLVERFEAVAAGQEFVNAYSEINDPIEQRERFEAQAALRAGGDDEAHPIDESYLQALEYGMPPTGGLGIGVDRLVMMLTDQASIREVILFPAMRPD